MNTSARGGELRVMIVTDQFEPMVGGVPTTTRELARGLAERGHAVAVVAPGSGGHGSGSGHPVDGVTDKGDGTGQVTVTFRGSLPWPWYQGQRLGFLPRSAARELIGAFAPDIAHLHSPLTLGVAARSAARRQRIPVIYTNHFLPANVHPGAARRQATALTRAAGGVFDTAFYGFVTGFANRCDRVTAPTMTALRLLRSRGLRAPSQVVSNGVDLAVYAPGPADDSLRARYALPAGRPLILSVGRLSPEKHMDVLIEAVAGMAERDVLLVLAGSGPDSGRLRELAARRGVTSQVRFTGFVPGTDLPGLYRLADVFTIASEAELQSLTSMEAMASGLPVVAADAGALRELVRAGENGFLTRPGHAAEVAACLDLLCRDPGLRTRMSKASSRIIGDHDRHRVLARWESIYRALAARRQEQAEVSDGQP